MNREQLFSNIKRKKSYLCIGLDTDITKIPRHLLKAEDPVYEFNKQIVEATEDLCVAYKPNFAFYECLGPRGLKSLEKTLYIISDDMFKIADAKRGDIGHTSQLYAQAFYEYYNFDAVTVAPYMGKDSITPFLKFKDKWVVLLVLTSNQGAMDFQFIQKNEDKLFQKVIEKANLWGTPDNMMFVAGATQSTMFQEIRSLAPDNFLLVPGVGAQGGSLEEISKYGMNSQCGLLVNCSRSILYVSDKEDFAEKARMEALRIQNEMEQLLDKYLV